MPASSRGSTAASRPASIESVGRAGMGDAEQPHASPHVSATRVATARAKGAIAGGIHARILMRYFAVTPHSETRVRAPGLSNVAIGGSESPARDAPNVDSR